MNHHATDALTGMLSVTQFVRNIWLLNVSVFVCKTRCRKNTDRKTVVRHMLFPDGSEFIKSANVRAVVAHR